MDTDSLILYKIAYQRKEGHPIEAWTMKEENPAMLLTLMKRVIQFKSMTEFAFFEVHEILKTGEIRIVFGDMSRKWPVGVPTQDKGFVVRGKPSVPSMPTGIEKYDLGEKKEEVVPPAPKYTENVSTVRPLTMKVA